MESTALQSQLVSDQSSSQCPNCGSAKVETTMIDHEFPYGTGPSAVTLSARVPLRSCSECGFSFLDCIAEEAQHEAICRHLRLLTPAEVKAIRKSYGMTRAEFARVTRLGEATVGRWERGELLQNAAYDQFLYILSYPENMERLTHRYGNFNPPAPSPAENRSA
jgi:putative zinc finger/helix-turn-helix YgiT family protein